MPPPDDHSQPPHPARYGGAGQFAATHWTVVLAAGREGPERAEALEQFARAYWYPIYSFIRKKGHGPEAAEDLTQEFFRNMLETDWLANVERRPTRFSTLLLTILNRFLVDDYRRERQQKRGGNLEVISIDMAAGEGWYGLEPATHESPERIFERRYAQALLQRALEAMGAEMRAAGRGKHFELLSPFLSREPEFGEYPALATALAMSTPNAVAAAARRLRLAYRNYIRAEVAAGEPDEELAQAELRHLVIALSDAPIA